MSTMLEVNDQPSILNIDGCRTLIASIIIQGFVDAKSTSDYQWRAKQSALKYINKNNKVFCYHCDLIDLDPEWVASLLIKNLTDESYHKIIKRKLLKTRKKQIRRKKDGMPTLQMARVACNQDRAFKETRKVHHQAS